MFAGSIAAIRLAMKYSENWDKSTACFLPSSLLNWWGKVHSIKLVCLLIMAIKYVHYD